MVEFKYTLTGDEGLHARPAGHFAKKAQGFPDKITVAKGEKKADAKRLFSVINLQINKGDEIVITVEGDSEAGTAQAMKDYCASTL
ncbi:MAG: HPr family phosphocarrier protein [Treponema sp.]|nr:HPr family phosphocarrier protein [Treponema sp.]